MYMNTFIIHHTEYILITWNGSEGVNMTHVANTLAIIAYEIACIPF